MINFQSMFGGTRGAQNNSLSQILSLPNVGLMRLLDEQTFVSEFKSATGRVQDYMSYKRYSELVELVTQVGSPMDKKRSYKFPLTACELLTSDNPKINDFLLPDALVVVQEEKVLKSVEHEVEQEVEDDDDEVPMPQGEAEKGEEKGEGEKGEAAEGQKQGGEGGEKAGEEEEQFGEFVAAPVRAKKIVKVKQVVETVEIVKKELPALIDVLLDYFKRDMNYTLTAYVCRILTSLLNRKPSKFLSRIFATTATTDAMLTHIASRSVVELLVRILTIENKESASERLELLRRVFVQLGVDSSVENLSNLSSCAREVFEKANLHFKTIIPIKELAQYHAAIPELLATAVSHVLREEELVSSYAVPVVHILLSSYPPDADQIQLDAPLKLLVEGSLERLRKSIEESRPRLGMARVKLLEILSMLLKRGWVREWAAGQVDFFSVLLTLVRQYPLNNILHNKIFRIVSSALTPETPSLTANLLSEEKLLVWLEEEAELEKERLTSEKRKLPKGYAGHLVALCKQLREAAGSNPTARSLVEDDRFLAVLRILVEKQVTLNQRNLAGYAVLRTGKNQILFSKEEILQIHSAFLAKPPPTVYEEDLDDPMQNPAILEELQRQLDGIQVDNPDVAPEVVEEEKHKAELIEENDEHKSAFWKVHIEYDVDDLMNELL